MTHSSEGIYLFILQSVIIGFFLGGVYEVFRILRTAAVMTGKRALANIVRPICDILFFILCAIISAIFIFYANNGSIRGIALAGSLLGFAAYYNSVGRLVSLITRTLIRGVYRLLNCFSKYILLPVCRLFLDTCDHIYTRRQTGRRIRKFKKKGC